VLDHLRHHDARPLSEDLRDPFTRLQLRADHELAWSFFTT
jgi:archaellum biogenesis protein FlaJ (TadC family)